MEVAQVLGGQGLLLALLADGVSGGGGRRGLGRGGASDGAVEVVQEVVDGAAAFPTKKVPLQLYKKSQFDLDIYCTSWQRLFFPETYFLVGGLQMLNPSIKNVVNLNVGN